MSRETNILMVGIGGHGVVSASDILALVAARAGLDVKKSEVHGMAQRGGVVDCHVRFGDEVHSALIKKGTAHILMAFEELEALRWCEYLSGDGVVLVNRLMVVPPSSWFKKEAVPANAIETLAEFVKSVYSVPAYQMAQELGNTKLGNTVMLGSLSVLLDFDPGLWEEVISERFRRAALENIKAFRVGREFMLGEQRH